MAKKERLDVLVVAQGLCETREKAQKYIMAGMVLVNDQKVDKAGTKVPIDSHLRLVGEPLPYASRGGFKLAEAFERFPISMKDAVVVDLGASTGGFVDCALQHGAKRVYAVDVGYGQLAWKLRTDERVINMEKTNARFLTPEDFPELMDWMTTDVAFISLTKILPAAYSILKEDGSGVALIKPQFEAGRDKVGKNGVVRDPAVHEEVIQRILTFNEELGFKTLGIVHSPIQGPQGNIEYLYWFTKDLQATSVSVDIHELVTRTFADFSKKESH
ncbi:MAG: TlyA family RNA methyltransferase [Peptococcaceae bacterium]|nr:TlyA family RNA methyltransferase [Peptococcaceae bacterium]